MTPNAYEMLATWHLPYPATYTLNCLLDSTDERKMIFVRRKGPDSEGPRFISVGELLRAKEKYEELIKVGRVLQFEEARISTNGGCVAYLEADIYAEFVAGHLSGLLRHGWWQHRTLEREGHTLRAAVQQTAMVQQTIDGTSIVPARQLPSRSIDNLQKTLVRYADNVTRPVLLEFIVDANEEVFFVDYKPYPRGVDFACIFDDRQRSKRLRPFFTLPSAGLTAKSLVELRADVRDGKAEVRVGQDAALSHHFTHRLVSDRV
jgi:hypothetical protein